MESDTDVCVLDVRESFERAIACIPVPDGAEDVFIPLREIPSRTEELKRRLKPGAPLVVYCHHGVRSRMVAEWLVTQGFHDVSNLEGGIEAYSLEVDAEVRRY
jgi:rhodanese-related sulfurtransferase